MYGNFENDRLVMKMTKNRQQNDRFFLNFVFKNGRFYNNHFEKRGNCFEKQSFS